MMQSADSTTPTDGRHDFDFLMGSWNVRNRRLERPLTGSVSWYEFASAVSELPILGGLGNLEQYDAPDARQPIHAIALRLFDIASRTWNISWCTAGSRASGEPLIGQFVDGVGTFIAREQYEGRDILVRFLWTHAGANEAK